MIKETVGINAETREQIFELKDILLCTEVQNHRLSVEELLTITFEDHR